MAQVANKANCPYICPTNEQEAEKMAKEESVSVPENLDKSPYVPGRIKPPEPKVYPPGAPPIYLPQPTESTSGDILAMGPIGPWAPGHVDWTPQAGMTGVRPVVDKYSMTRYSTGEWRKNNEMMLRARQTEKAKAVEIQTKKDMQDAFKGMDNKYNETNKNLNIRIKEVAYWKKEVEKTIDAMANEIAILDEERTRLKGASRILNLPEAISRECLELRTHRYEPDSVRDDAEQELVKEVAIVGEIRRVFNIMLVGVEIQMANNRAAKSALEMDWSDKMVSLVLDKKNLETTPRSALILKHPGVARWPENASGLDYWEHYCKESIKNCEEVRQKSQALREDISSTIKNGGQDMKLQADRTNAALAQTVSATEQLCEKLEETLKDNLQTIANVENLIDHLKDALRQSDEKAKLVMTRLHGRNYDRPGVENCRDEAQYSLMGEAKYVKETCESLKTKTREAEQIRLDLMKYRADLEKDIACKRKSLNIDKDRCARVRAHMPTPEEFAGSS